MRRTLFVLILLLVAVPPASAQPSVTAVRIGDHPDKTRFVIELSEEPRYRVFTLADPFRVVIDLPELEWKPPTGAIGSGNRLVTAMRFGLFAPGTSRVVLDLNRPTQLRRVFLMSPSGGYAYRLVLDMVAVGRATYFADRRAAPFASRIPLEPPRTALLAPPKPKIDARPTIVIDPGHGGVDPGARSRRGLEEKRIALDYARELKRQLEATRRFRVVLTRDRDVFVRLLDRVETAQRLHGDLSISLHANNHKSRKIRGVSIYTLSEKSSDQEAEALAAKENKADIIAGIDLSEQTEAVSKILIDLAQRETMNLSKQFANTMVGKVGKVAKLLGNTHRFAGFAVLKSPIVPSVLVEIGYLSNPTEERLLRSAKHRAKLTASIVKAIEAYFRWRTSLSQ